MATSNTSADPARLPSGGGARNTATPLAGIKQRAAVVGPMAGGRRPIQVPAGTGLIQVVPPTAPPTGTAVATTSMGVPAFHRKTIAARSSPARLLVTITAIAVADVETKAMAAKTPVATIAGRRVVASQGIGVGLAPPIPGGAPYLTGRAPVPAAARDVAPWPSRETIAPLMLPLPCGEGLPALHAVIDAPSSAGGLPPLIPEAPAAAASQTRGLKVAVAGPLAATLVPCVAHTARMLARPRIGRAAVRLPDTGARTMSDAARASRAVGASVQTVHTTGGTTPITGAGQPSTAPMRLLPWP